MAAASPLMTLYAFAILGLALQTHDEIVAQRIPALTISIVNNCATATFLGLQFALFLFRRLPVAKTRGWWPRLFAVVASNCAFLLLVLPHARASRELSMVSSLLLIAGTVGAIVVLFWLGRSFSITPQARGLVVGGPYRFVRHPLYLTEQIALAGIMLRYRQPWSLGVYLVCLALQFVRMDYEEQVLADAFPGYSAYAKGTARLIPGVY